MVARGEVRWYEDLRAGRRPFLVLTRDEAIPVLNQVIAVPVTSTVRGIPTEVPLDDADGMPGPCVLSVDNVTVIRLALGTELITRLSPLRLREVCGAWGHATTC